MSPFHKWALASFLLVIVMGGAFGAYYLSASSRITSQQNTVSGLESSISSLLSHPVSVTTTSVSTTTSLVTNTSTVLLTVPFSNPVFMIPPELPNELGGCSGSNCWGDSLSDAIKFDCPNGAAQGCTVEVYSSYFNGDVYYSIVASAFPQIGVPNEPNWANCSYNSYVLPVAG